ncbi:MAG: SpoIIE family protein phosphatase [Anaerolineae bacterium]|nr:MAG: SpoIIE family protein phosphatase [Anaerolineae bacterium]
MLTLKDFFHLARLDTLVWQLVADGPGLIVVAGLDPRPLAPPAAGDGFLPSGRAAIFRILMRSLLAAQNAARAEVVAENADAVRVPRNLRRRVQLSLVEPPRTYAEAIASAAWRQPDLLVVDRLCVGSASAALEAAQSGLRVLSQLDTVFRGAGVARSLLDLGVSRERIGALTWVIAVQRLPTLCPHCKAPTPPNPVQLAALRRRYPDLEVSVLHQHPELDFDPLCRTLTGEGGTFFQAAGCAACDRTGRHGDVAVFHVFRLDADAPSPFEQPSLLPLEEYALCLAALGHLSLDDVLQLPDDQLRRTYNLLAASERALSDANASLERKVAELWAANQVLQQRTEALVSLHDIGQALITSTDLDDLAGRVCGHARDLCGADRAILFFRRSEETAEVLAVSGWNPARVPQQVDAALAFGDTARIRPEPAPFNGWPPGIPPRHPDVEGVSLRAGLRVPLVAQGELVGVMFVHTTQKPGFPPGEVALLQTFAHQAALAVQRAGLIDELRQNIAQLQAAQAELVKKERLERELELARQVQQSVLPRIFPLMPGYAFAARNRPARQVGGDFYDVVLLDAHHFGLVIADVSDKGMPAALYMALTRSLLLAEARRQASDAAGPRSPCAVLRDVHRVLLELGEPNMFVTVFYGVVDAPARRLIYARAGHDRPLLLRDGTVQSLGGTGIFLGFPDVGDLNLSEEQIELASGDRLVLYTDGLTDALAPDGRPFDLTRLTATLQSHAGLRPDEACAAVFADLAAYQGPAEQYDDMTMLIVDVR